MSPSTPGIENEKEYGMKVASAMAVAGAVVTGWTSGVSEGPIAVPLFGFAAELREFGILEIAKLLIVIVLVYSGKMRWALFAAAGFTLMYWLARYSLLGAFVPQIVFSCLFLALIWNFEAKAKQVLASVCLGGIFLFAALQKMNTSYLGGLEFTSSDGFLSMFTAFSGTKVPHDAGKFLAVLSIGVELTLAVGLFLGKRIFAHLAVIFILLLSAVNPAVSFVYLCIAGLAVLADPTLAERIQSLKVGKYLATVSGWALLQLYLLPSYQLENSGTHWLTTLFRPIVFLLLFGGVHLYLFKEIAFKTKADTNWGRSLLENRLPIAILFFYFVAMHLLFHTGAPSPLGLSMFSSQVRKTSNYQLEFQSGDDCLLLSRSMKFTSVVDARINYFHGSCELNLPTESGLRHIEKTICRHGIRGEMISKNKSKGETRAWKCND